MYLYIISDGTNVKIGVSRNVASRLSTLQVGNSLVKLKLVLKANCKTDETAYQLEKLLHSRYKSVRVSGEWFAIDPKIIINDLAFIRSAFPFLLVTLDQDTIRDRVLSSMTRTEIEQYIESRWPTPKPVEVHDCSGEESPRFTKEFTRRAQHLNWVWDRNAHMSEEDHVTLRQIKENDLNLSEILPKLSTPERWRLHKRFEEEDNGSWPRAVSSVGTPFTCNEEMTHAD